MRLIIALFLLFSSTPAFAAGSSVLAQVFNTTLLFILLFVLTKKPIMSALSKRAKLIKDDLEQAQIALKRAEKQNRDLKADLDAMKVQINDLEVQAKKDAESLKEDLKVKAQQDIEKIKATTKQSIQSEVQSAKYELKQEVVRRAVELAENQLRVQMQKDDQTRLHKNFIQEISEQ